MKSLGECDYDFQKLVMKMEAKIEHMSPQEDARPFCCEHCGRQFSTSAYLSQHRRIHSGVKPYVCRFCDRKFTQLSHVQQHERIHTGEKPYSCVTCTKSFTQMSNLHSHQRQHMKNKPCKCSHCFMAFDVQQDLENHIESKHVSEKYHKILVCPICSKMYNSETYLTKHVERHDESSSKSTHSSRKSTSYCEPSAKLPRLSKHDDHNNNNNPGIDMAPPSSSGSQSLGLVPLYGNPIKDPSVCARSTADMCSSFDMSKSMVTAASGLRLDVILESLASSNCPSPLVSAAASVWGHSWFPSSNHNQIVNINQPIRSDINHSRSMCIDFMSLNKQSKFSHQSFVNGMMHRNHILSSSSVALPSVVTVANNQKMPQTTLTTTAITLPTLSQITERFISCTYSDPSNKAPHINTLTTAFH